MGLRGWSWEVRVGPAALGDRPLLEALQAAIPDAAVEAAISATGTRERRRRRLPTRLVVTLVVAMGLWATDAVRHVLASVVDGWREGDAAGATGWRLPSSPAIVRARQRAGARLLRVLFHAVAHPIATPETAGAFLAGLRLMAIDGTTLDVADTPENARAFGRPSTRRGAGAFPQIRLVALIETGTHVLCAAVIRPFRCGEAPAGRQLVRAVEPGMLLLWDRGFHSYEMVRATRARRPLPGAGEDERRADTDHGAARRLISGLPLSLAHRAPPSAGWHHGTRGRVRPRHLGRAWPGAVSADHLAPGRDRLPGRDARRRLS